MAIKKVEKKERFVPSTDDTRALAEQLLKFADKELQEAKRIAEACAQAGFEDAATYFTGKSRGLYEMVKVLENFGG